MGASSGGEADGLAQGLIDPILPARPLLLEVREHVLVEAQRDQLARTWNGSRRAHLGCLGRLRAEDGFCRILGIERTSWLLAVQGGASGPRIHESEGSALPTTIDEEENAQNTKSTLNKMWGYVWVKAPRDGRYANKTMTERRSLAEGAGFEPAIRFPVYTLSRRAPSTTRPPLRIAHPLGAHDAGARCRTCSACAAGDAPLLPSGPPPLQGNRITTTGLGALAASMPWSGGLRAA